MLPRYADACFPRFGGSVARWTTFNEALTFDPRNPVFAEFTLRLDAAGAFYLQRSDLSGPLKTFGKGFSAVEFKREQKSCILVRLESQLAAKGAQNNDRTLIEISENQIYLPGAR